MSDADVIVVGAGHNGLICAAYLARAGVRVLVLEARSAVGGCASTVDAVGARVNICNCDHSMVRGTSILDELGLADHGLRYLEVDPEQLAISWSGAAPWFHFHDVDRTLASIAVAHPDEVDGYRRYLKVARPVADLVREVTSAPPTPGSVLRSVADRRFRGVKGLLALSRRSVGDVVRSFFRSEALRAPVVTGGPAVWGLSPETPGTGLGALGYAMKHLQPVGRPVGGSGSLPTAILAALTQAGGRVRTGARVSEILVDGERVRGVRLAPGAGTAGGPGEVVEAPMVVVATDPRRAILEWLRHPPPSAAKLVERWRDRPEGEGYESKLDAVIAERPRYLGLDDATLARHGVDQPLGPTALVSPSLAEMGRAHALMADGAVAERPMFYVNVPSVLDETMRAPGGDVFSLEVLYTPYRLAGGWDGSAEPQRWLDRFASLVEPGFLDGVRDWRVVTPPDYERDFNLTKGHAPSFSGGPLGALLRKDPELTRYETPVQGLFLTGAATFPGAGVWGASGRSAAHVVLGRITR